MSHFAGNIFLEEMVQAVHSLLNKTNLEVYFVYN